MLPLQYARSNEQVVEMLVNYTAQQMLAEVGYFGVFVDDQHPPRFSNAAAERLPVVGEDAPQIENVEHQPQLARQLVGGLDAERQRSSITDDRNRVPFA